MPKLTPEEIAALRTTLPDTVEKIAFAEGTEAPFSHALNSEKRGGEFHCGVCGEFLFASDHKYDSGSGWPSFFKPADFKLAIPRTEIHCANCGAHLGHVFEDGPQPTGQRYCVNGSVLDFKPDNEEG